MKQKYHKRYNILQNDFDDLKDCFAGNSTICEESGENNLQKYLYVLVLGQILHGVGGQTLYCLGVIFLDANVRTEVSPLYQGMAFQ